MDSEVNLVPNIPSEFERINTQWNGWLYRDNCQRTSDASGCFNLNTGSSSAGLWSCENGLLDNGDDMPDFVVTSVEVTGIYDVDWNEAQ